MAAMERGMRETPTRKPRNASLESSTLAMVADDDTLAREFGDDPSVTVTADLVTKLTASTSIDVRAAVNMIARAQEVALCFVVDTTSSMDPCIAAVKDQITAIVTNLESSNCRLTGLAFVG